MGSQLIMCFPVHAVGPGVVVKVIVVYRSRVLQAPLGESFRVLTEEAAEKVGLPYGVQHHGYTFINRIYFLQ